MITSEGGEVYSAQAGDSEDEMEEGSGGRATYRLEEQMNKL